METNFNTAHMVLLIMIFGGLLPFAIVFGCYLKDRRHWQKIEWQGEFGHCGQNIKCTCRRDELFK